MMRERTADRARGHWQGLLPQLGVPAGFLNGKHQPCPMCGGKDRARFDDKQGNGTWFCTHCGAGTGISLVMKLRGWSFQEAVGQIDQILGTVPVATVRPERTDEAKREAMRRMWKAASPVQAGDPVARYLARRGLALTEFPAALRTAQRIRYHREPASYHPCMLAKFSSPVGAAAILHRTYLTAEGEKAAVEAPRRMMPGSMPRGGAVRLAEAAEVMGIAEGIETALSALALFGVPCWAATGDAMLRAWAPPEGVRRVLVFGDADASYTGQAAAYVLAKRLVSEGRQVEVRLPFGNNRDWNDILTENRA